MAVLRLIMALVLVQLFKMNFMAQAQAAEPGQVELLEKEVVAGPNGSQPTITTFEQYANLMFTTIFALAVAMAVVKLAWAGFIYASSEIISTKSEAKKSITNVFIGIIIALGAYLLLKTINPDLVNFKLDSLGKLKSNESTPQPQVRESDVPLTTLGAEG